MTEEGKSRGSSLQRIGTGIVLASVVLLGVLSNAFFFLSLIWLVIFVSAFEWTSFIGLRDYLSKLIYSTLVLALCVLCFYSAKSSELLSAFVLMGVVFWFFVTILIYRAAEDPGLFRIEGGWFFACAGVVILSSTCASLIYLYEQSSALLIVLLSTVCSVDTFAYFGGKSKGRRKFVPSISPRKTWEGVWFGVAGGSLVSLISGYFLLSFDVPILLCLTFATVLFAVVGDLLESLFKRMANLKDSGNLLPGHGGVLDRVDSLLAGAPVFAGITILAGVYE